MKRHHGGRPISAKRVRRGKRLRKRYSHRRRFACARGLTLALNAYIKDHHEELGLWSWTTAQVTYQPTYKGTPLPYTKNMDSAEMYGDGS